MILELLNRVFRIGPERQLEKLRTVLAEKELEIESLRRQISALEVKIEEQRGKEEGHKRERRSKDRSMQDVK